MTETFRVACLQTSASREMAENIAAVVPMIERARADGADFITTPEMVAMIEPKRPLHLAKAQGEETHPVLAAFRESAAKTGAWLLAGSMSVKLEGERLANRSFLIDPTGQIKARYDKIHMFDVDLAGGESYRESATYRPGDRAVLANLPWGTLGMTICYDMRFPQLYRTLAQAGAMFITVPSAFTRPTGQAHWHVLLRSRAIETGCFIIAPAQCGEHAEGRKTYGHSLVVSPWGEVLADGGDGVGISIVEIEPKKVREARGMVPSLDHDRAFAGPKVAAGVTMTKEPVS
jgi:deaminated glutathione amidase